jgi:hypothetical protein
LLLFHSWAGAGTAFATSPCVKKFCVVTDGKPIGYRKETSVIRSDLRCASILVTALLYLQACKQQANRDPASDSSPAVGGDAHGSASSGAIAAGGASAAPGQDPKTNLALTSDDGAWANLDSGGSGNADSGAWANLDSGGSGNADSGAWANLDAGGGASEASPGPQPSAGPTLGSGVSAPASVFSPFKPGATGATSSIGALFGGAGPSTSLPVNVGGLASGFNLNQLLGGAASGAPQGFLSFLPTF